MTKYREMPRRFEATPMSAESAMSNAFYVRGREPEDSAGLQRGKGSAQCTHWIVQVLNDVRHRDDVEIILWKSDFQYVANQYMFGVPARNVRGSGIEFSTPCFPPEFGRDSQECSITTSDVQECAAWLRTARYQVPDAVINLVLF
jgi:hypothetical protein